MNHIVYSLLIALFAPLILIPLEKLFPWPHIFEELVKLLIVYLLIKIEKQQKIFVFNWVVFAGVLFTLSESIFYLINIFVLGDLTIISKRLFLTGILHIGTLLIMYLFGRKNNFVLIAGLILSIIIHYQYNLWAARFF